MFYKFEKLNSYLLNEQAWNLAFSADGDERLLGIGVSRDIAFGNGHAVIGQKALDLYAIRAASHNVEREFMISSHGVSNRLRF